MKNIKIENEAEYIITLKRIELLFDDDDPKSERGQELESLINSVLEYENVTYKAAIVQW